MLEPIMYLSNKFLLTQLIIVPIFWTFDKQHAFNEMDLAAYVADFKLLSKTQSSYIVKDSKLLHRHGEFMSIYDYFILDDTSFNQKYVVYESSFKNL